jgi:4-hydroxythreonine-4-phosphate dehydrogenase
MADYNSFKEAVYLAIDVSVNSEYQEISEKPLRVRENSSK